MDYIAKLVTETEHESTRLPVDSQRDREKIHSCLSQLQDTAIVFRTTLATALRALHVQCLRPRIKQLCSELFTNLRYILADDEYTESELLGGMPVVSTTVLANLVSEGAMGTSITREGFVKKVTGTMDRALAEGRYREFLTDNNFAALLQLCVEHLVREWEAAIMASASSRFNALGRQCCGCVSVG